MGTWLTQTDEAILKVLSGNEADMPPAVIHHNMDIDRSATTVHRRMRPLRDAGLIERIPDTDGYYRLTDLGHDVVNDRLSRPDINELEPDSD